MGVIFPPSKFTVPSSQETYGTSSQKDVTRPREREAINCCCRKNIFFRPQHFPLKPFFLAHGRIAESPGCINVTKGLISNFSLSAANEHPMGSTLSLNRTENPSWVHEKRTTACSTFCSKLVAFVGIRHSSLIFNPLCPPCALHK